jgi:hypothetical protein
MAAVVDELRAACAQVASRAEHVRIVEPAIAAYAAALPLDTVPAASGVGPRDGAEREELAAYWITLDAINFGSGWFPTLRKRPGHSGYATVSAGLRDHFARRGPWRAAELTRLAPADVAAVLGQDPDHELMALFARSLRDLGEHAENQYRGSFSAVADSAAGSAVALAHQLGGWECFADVATYGGLQVPFLKRAQIAAADLARAGVARFGDLARLTMFADNLVPHVLRLDGVLTYTPQLAERIERSELLDPGGPAEVELRACAVQAVELIVAARPGSCAAAVDRLLWLRGGQPHYKAVPRHRCRCTAY